MSNNLEKRLQLALEKLEEGVAQVKKTRPYGKEEAKLRMLTEMVKEQMSHENSHSTTRQTR